jgi:type IV pilus assembly protein PilM
MAGTLVGLDVGSHSVKVVELARAGGRLRIARSAVVPTPPGGLVEGAVGDPKVLGPAIRRAFDQAGIRNRRVNTALSGRAVVVREIRLPAMPDEELAQAVRFEAERYLPAGSKDAAVDFQVLERVQEGQTTRVDVLFVAARRELVDGFTSALQEAGVTPEVLEVTSFALMRLFQEEAKEGAVVLADLGADSSEILVVHKGRLRLARTIPVAGNSLTRAVAGLLGLEPSAAQAAKEEKGVAVSNPASLHDPTSARIADAIVPVLGDILTEVRRSVDYFYSRWAGESVRKVILTGGTARLQNIAALFADELNVPAEVGDTFRVVSADGLDSSLAPVLATATGLALRGAEG